MGLPRLILLGIIIGGGMWLWRRFNRRLSTHAPNPNTAEQTMVRCAHCHVHLPQDRATKKGESWYCSTKHLQLGPKARD